MANRHTFITQEATTPAQARNYKELACFHYHNPNGVWHRKRAIDDVVRALVDQGKCRSGALMAHGSLNSHSTEYLVRQASRKEPNPRKLSVAINGMEHDIDQALGFIARALRGEVPQPLQTQTDQVQRMADRFQEGV